MRSGPMRYRITFFTKPPSQDTFLDAEDSAGPQEVFSCWASITVATSKEIYALGAGFTGQVTHKITIRYPDTLPASGMTIQFTKRGITRTFTLQTFGDPDERGRELDLMVLEESK